MGTYATYATHVRGIGPIRFPKPRRQTKEFSGEKDLDCK
jgi:hypothetical protein